MRKLLCSANLILRRAKLLKWNEEMCFMVEAGCKPVAVETEHRCHFRHLETTGFNAQNPSPAAILALSALC